MKRSRESKQGITWFFNMIRMSAKDFNYNTFSPAKDPFIGGLLFFMYDAKYKDKLPYWDKFPLVIPFDVGDGTFIGLNLHYLPIEARKKLLDILLPYKTKKSMRDYMKISYSIIKSISKHDLIKPCIHRYLNSHVKSRFVKVNHEDWYRAAALPVQRFVKGSPY